MSLFCVCCSKDYIISCCQEGATKRQALSGKKAPTYSFVSFSDLPHKLLNALTGILVCCVYAWQNLSMSNWHSSYQLPWNFLDGGDRFLGKGTFVFLSIVSMAKTQLSSLCHFFASAVETNKHRLQLGAHVVQTSPLQAVSTQPTMCLLISPLRVDR